MPSSGGGGARTVIGSRNAAGSRSSSSNGVRSGGGGGHHGGSATNRAGRGAQPRPASSPQRRGPNEPLELTAMQRGQGGHGYPGALRATDDPLFVQRRFEPPARTRRGWAQAMTTRRTSSCRRRHPCHHPCHDRSRRCHRTAPTAPTAPTRPTGTSPQWWCGRQYSLRRSSGPPSVLLPPKQD